MNDLSLMAATEWAKAQAGNHHDPAEFGRRVTQVYLAARTSTSSAGDEILKSAGFANKARPAAGPLDRGPTLRELLRGAGINPPSVKPTPTPEQRANALELAGILSRYVRCGSAIEGAIALADRLGPSKTYERAAELIFSATPSPSSVCLDSWADLIEVADAVDAWLRTGDLPADPAVLLRVFPSVAAYQ